MKPGANQPINISDFIGIIIAFIAFVYMAIRPFIVRMKRPVDPENPSQDPFMDDEDEFDEYEVPIKRKIVTKVSEPPRKKWDNERFKFKTEIENRHKASAVEQQELKSSVALRKLKEFEADFQEEISVDEAYAINPHTDPSNAENILKGTTLRNSLIASVILSEPRGVRMYDGRPRGV